MQRTLQDTREAQSAAEVKDEEIIAAGTAKERFMKEAAFAVDTDE